MASAASGEAPTARSEPSTREWIQRAGRTTAGFELCFTAGDNGLRMLRQRACTPRLMAVVVTPIGSSQPFGGRLFGEREGLGPGIHGAGMAGEEQIAGDRCAQLLDHFETVQID